jgi:hypothetical protein
MKAVAYQVPREFAETSVPDPGRALRPLRDDAAGLKAVLAP